MKKESYLQHPIFTFPVIIEGIHFENIEFSIDDPVVKWLCLDTKESGLTHLRFAFINSKALNWGEFFPALVEKTINKIAFFYEIEVNAPCFNNEYNAPNFNKITSKIYMENTRTENYLMNTKKISDLDNNFMQLVRMQDNPVKNTYYNLFRFVMQSDEPVTRYMFLYSILLQIFGDKQKKVEKFIITNEPNVEQSPRPDKPKIIETVYTRLRNEIGHCRPNTTLNQTSKEITTKVEQLTKLTKKAIEQIT